MADTKISSLPAASALTGAELVPIVQGGDTKKATAQDIADLADSPVTSVAGRTGAVTLAAADITDSTVTGRAVVTAADAAAGRTAIGAEASGAASTAVSAHAAATDPHGDRAYAAAQDAAHVAAGDPHPQYALESALGDAAGKNVGTATNTVAVGDDARFSSMPQNSKSADYTLVLTDGGKCIYHPSADTTARTWTVPANASVPFADGTVITMDNDYGAGDLTVNITSDTMVMVGTSGTTGSFTIPSGGQAVLRKAGATRWRVSVVS